MKLARTMMVIAVVIALGNVATASAFVGECSNFQIDQQRIVQLLLKAGLEGTTNSNFKNIDVAVEEMIGDIASKGIANSQDFDADQKGRDCAYALAEEAKEKWSGYMAKYAEKKRVAEEAEATVKAEVERHQRENEARITAEAKRKQAEIDVKRREEEARIAVEAERKRNAEVKKQATAKKKRKTLARKRANEKRKREAKAAKLRKENEGKATAGAKGKAEQKAKFAMDKAWLAIIDKDYETAIQILTELAESGRLRAQLDLGLLYEAGRGVPRSDKNALLWFIKAAEQGHTDTQYKVGKFFAEGNGVNVSYAVAAEWFLMAARRGHVDAQFSIAEMYFSGSGVEESFEKAEIWYAKAEKQGHPKAEIKLRPYRTKGSPVYKAVKKQRRFAEERKREVEKEKLHRLKEQRRKATIKKKQKMENARKKAEAEKKSAEKALARKRADEKRSDPSLYEPGDKFKDCNECPEMIVTPSGNFRMGDLSGVGRFSEKPAHKVNINYTFAIGKFEVTQAEWRSMMGTKPSKFMGDNKPVENISWGQAKKYVSKLNDKLGLRGRSDRYRLPSEAEWEYSARAGTTTKYHFGNTISKSQAAYDRWSKGPVDVGSYPANNFGLHDFHGNVREWVEDCFSLYSATPRDGSPMTKVNCKTRTIRGGSWSNITDDAEWHQRSAARDASSPQSGWGGDHGFRVARTLSR
jgi:formylglycine-generating enzyme required for sulfatase activity